MKKIIFRAVEPEDIDLLFSVENDISAWFSSETTAPLSRHLLLQYALSYRAAPFDDGQLRMIALDAATSLPIGIADFYDLSAIHRHSLIGIYILPYYRNNGWATVLINAMAEYASNNLSLKELAARIASSNEPALKAFLNSGFIKAGELKQWYLSGEKMMDITILQRSL